MNTLIIINLVIILLLLFIWWDLLAIYHELKEDINHNKKNNIVFITIEQPKLIRNIRV